MKTRTFTSLIALICTGVVLICGTAWALDEAVLTPRSPGKSVAGRGYRATPLSDPAIKHDRRQEQPAGLQKSLSGGTAYATAMESA